jgi:chromate transport protein ChrA
MIAGNELIGRSRRFVVDALTVIAAVLLAVAAFTATIDPYLLIVLAALIGIALKIEPRRPKPSGPSESEQSIAEAKALSA